MRWLFVGVCVSIACILTAAVFWFFVTIILLPLFSIFFAL